MDLTPRGLSRLEVVGFNDFDGHVANRLWDRCVGTSPGCGAGVEVHVNGQATIIRKAQFYAHDPRYAQEPFPMRR
jgi:hypothetical protein